MRCRRRLREWIQSILTVESVRGVGTLAAPMILACSCARVGRGRVPLGGGTMAGASAATLSADCSALHCRLDCRALYLRLEWLRGQQDLAASHAPLVWCITAVEGVIWGSGADTYFVSTICSSASTCLLSGAKYLFKYSGLLTILIELIRSVAFKRSSLCCPVSFYMK